MKNSPLVCTYCKILCESMNSLIVCACLLQKWQLIQLLCVFLRLFLPVLRLYHSEHRHPKLRNCVSKLAFVCLLCKYCVLRNYITKPLYCYRTNSVNALKERPVCLYFKLGHCWWGDTKAIQPPTGRRRQPTQVHVENCYWNQGFLMCNS